MINLKFSFWVLTFLLNFAVIVCQDSQSYQEEYQTSDDPSLQYITEFQQTVQSIFPTQSFSLQVSPEYQEIIQLWPPADTQQVIFTFYTHNQQSLQIVTGEGLLIFCQLNGQLIKQFTNKKVGAYTFQLKTEPNIIILKLRSQQSFLSVYLSYEYKKIQRESSSAENKVQISKKSHENERKLLEVERKFEFVGIKSEKQNNGLRTIIKSLGGDDKKLQSNIEYVRGRIIIQTVAVVVSGVIGLWIINKQLRKGYQMLV